MIGKNLLDGLQGPVSQSVAAIKALLQWKHRAVDPLPSVLEFTQEGEEGRLVLVLSNDKRSYYVTTERACSCPAASYHQGPCKHQRKYFGAKVAAPEATASESLIEHGGFKPFDELPSERAAKAVPSMLPDLHDTTPREAAYHSIQADKLLWPMEA
jgi:hypothetical protein